MKKVILSALFVLSLLSLSACQKNDEILDEYSESIEEETERTENAFDEFLSTMEDTEIDLEDLIEETDEVLEEETETVEEVEEIEEVEREYRDIEIDTESYFDKIGQYDDTVSTFSINGKELTLPIKVSDFYELGYSILNIAGFDDNSNEIFEDVDINSDTLRPAYYGAEIDDINEEYRIVVTVESLIEDDYSTLLKDCYITSIAFNRFQKVDSKSNIVVYKGMDMNTTLDSIPIEYACESENGNLYVTCTKASDGIHKKEVSVTFERGWISNVIINTEEYFRLEMQE